MIIANAQNEFKSLFDSKSLRHTYGKSTVGDAWKVENGTLHFDPTAKKKKGDLVTDKEYSNFHLKLDWKVAPKQIAE
jgi:hypothetical protein